MAKFRTKVKHVEAVCWEGERFSSEPQWLLDAMAQGDGEIGRVHIDEERTPWVEGGFMEMAMDEGDWLIRMGDRDLHIVDGATFAADYEPDYDPQRR
ncbi:MAG: hypothetical protein AB7F35_29770 [Acetobacteraceae bacterium]